MLFGRFHNALCNYGLTDEEYGHIRKDFAYSNYKTLKVLGFIGVIYMLAVGTVAIFFFKSKNAWIAYYSCALLTLIASLCNVFITPKNDKTLKYWIYIVLISFMLTGGVMGLYFQNDKTAVAYVGFLIILPILFSDRPYRIAFTIVVMIIGYICLSIPLKPEEVWQTDLVNVLTFGSMSGIISIFIGRGRVRNFYSEYQVFIMAKIDSLTGTRNRNFYEEMLIKYPNEIKKSISCIYIDVNGLHELNNEKGHEAGDNMLKCVSSIMLNELGSDYVYRTGGDEFVGFIINKDEELMNEKSNNIRKLVDEAGYHVAIGAIYKNEEELDMHDLVKNAEKLMYDDKKAFYNGKLESRPRS